MARRHFIHPEAKWLMLPMAYNRLLKQEEIARVTGVKVRTIQRMLNTYRKTGNVVRVPLQCGRPRLLNGIDMEFLESLIEKTPDIYLEEMQEELYMKRGVDAHLSTISRSLAGHGYSRKKVTRPAKEQNDLDRATFKLRIAFFYEAEQLVFLDESACDRRSARRSYAWSVTGTRARCRDFFVRGQRYSMLPAMSLDGVIAFGVQKGALTRRDFKAFLELLMTKMRPFPEPNSVIVMDNARIHKSEEITEMVETRGMKIEYLPPYSPDFNPLEEGFSSIKASLRRNRDYVLGELDGRANSDPYTMLFDAVYSSLTAGNARSWFKHSNYAVA